MMYDVWGRPDLQYVYNNPYKHGRPYPSKYVIPDYRLIPGKKGIDAVEFSFPIRLKIDKDRKVIITLPSWVDWFEEDTREVYEEKEVTVWCRMEIDKRGGVFFMSNLPKELELKYGSHVLKGVLFQNGFSERNRFWSDQGSLVFPR